MGRSPAQRDTGVDRIFGILNTCFLLFWLVIVLYPIVYIISASFSSTYAIISGRVFLFPVEPGLMGYEAVFKNKQVWTGYTNSIFYTLAGTAVNVVLTIMAAYPLSRKDFVGRRIFTAILVFTMFFHGLLIPTFLLVRNLGMYNTRWAMIVPNAMGVWFVIIARTYIQSNIPLELLESAQLEGTSNTRFIVRIVVPLCAPVIAVLVLWYGVGHWNAYFNALIYLKDSELFPLQIILRNILVRNQIDAEMIGLELEQMEQTGGLRELLKYSLIIVASVPVLLIYPFVQRYFVKGIMIGAFKG